MLTLQIRDLGHNYGGDVLPWVGRSTLGALLFTVLVSGF